MVQRQIQPTAQAPILKGLRRLSTLILLLVLVQCTRQQSYIAVHPHMVSAMKPVPAVFALGQSFLLTRGDWFSRTMEIPSDSIYDRLGILMDQSFRQGLTQGYSQQLQVLPDSLRRNWPNENLRVDERVYVRGQLPQQGQRIGAFDRVLLIHEFTVGTDLDKEDFYDYDRANQSREVAKGSPQQLTVIVTYSLWDNAKQRALCTGVSEAAVALSAGLPTELLLQTLAQKAAQALLQDIKKAAP